MLDGQTNKKCDCFMPPYRSKKTPSLTNQGKDIEPWTFHIQVDIIGTNFLTKFHKDHVNKENAPPPGSHFHEDPTVNVASRVVHFFQPNIIIFKLIQDIIKTNLLTKFHEDWTKNVASRVLTRKNARPWWPYIIGTNLLTKFHDYQKINVAS
ncbi:hypothetical protein DPMN_007931 [Dreissena polymorpha]|uniref:Uncharacterized protein n=1 Tax=Dreissena polymorpha TaxID=45954 RepID=A0A9D4MXV4_DREPO|nr:hypothetical protein DPMN_007931 [Dreissena polymorpha]